MRQWSVSQSDYLQIKPKMYWFVIDALRHNQSPMCFEIMLKSKQIYNLQKIGIILILPVHMVTSKLAMSSHYLKHYKWRITKSITVKPSVCTHKIPTWVHNEFNNSTVIRHLMTGIRSKKCVVRWFRHCANIIVYLHKPK
jgi:hypothetical protein